MRSTTSTHGGQKELDHHGGLQSNTNGPSPLEMHVHGHRVFMGTFVSIAVLVLITAIFLQGVELKTVNTVELSDDQRRVILDQYNSYSGFIASIVSIPFQQLPAVLLPVFFLYFTTHSVMAEHKSSVMKRGPMVAVAAASSLLGLGLSSLNVQFDTPEIQYIMTATDLVAKQVDASNFSNLTSATSSVGVPSTDTILRSAIVTSIKISDKSSCSYTFSPFSQKPEASIEYGFTLNSWLDSLLPNSLAPSKSFKFSMNDNFTNQQIHLPTSDLRKTGSLMTGAFLSVVSQFAWESGSLGAYIHYMPVLDIIESTDPENLLANTQTFIESASSIIDSVDKANIWYNKTSFWHSIATSEISVELSNFQLSPEILFEAVTIELPLTTDTMDDWVAKANHWSDGRTKINIDALCAAIGCVIDTPNVAGSNQDQVRLIPLCAGENEFEIGTMISEDGCLTISNSSVLVFSLARNVEAIADVDNWTLNLTNPRTTFQATVGRLSWTTNDLSKIYGSACAEGTDCRGLRFPLSDEKRHLMLGEQHIPVPQQALFIQPAFWQTLVVANTQLDAISRADVVAYNLTARMASTNNASRIPDDFCFIPVDNYVNKVIERHLYSKDSVYPAYLAALFWLFQDAAVRQVATENALNTTVVQLLLDGNLSWTSVHAAIPLMAACATFAGCGIILVLALLVAYQSHNQQRQTALAHHIAAHNVNAVLADENQFPPSLVSVRVKQQSKTSDPEAKSSSTRIEQFEIIRTTITLRNRLNMSVHEVTIGSGCTAPDERMPSENVLVVEIKDTPNEGHPNGHPS